MLRHRLQRLIRPRAIRPRPNCRRPNLADFLFGNQSSYSLTNYVIVHLRQRFNFMYFQDDIKVTPNLTINAGLRYEIGNAAV